MQTHNSANGECSGVDRGPSRTTAWPPLWLLSASGGQCVEPSQPDAPQDAITSDPQAMLQPIAESPATSDASTKPICRCGGTTWRDVPIHGGQSVRRDCGRCGRLLDFPVWYGRPTADGSGNVNIESAARGEELNGHSAAN